MIDLKHLILEALSAGLPGGWITSSSEFVPCKSLQGHVEAAIPYLGAVARLGSSNIIKKGWIRINNMGSHWSATAIQLPSSSQRKALEQLAMETSREVHLYLLGTIRNRLVQIIKF